MTTPGDAQTLRYWRQAAQQFRDIDTLMSVGGPSTVTDSALARLNLALRNFQEAMTQRVPQ